jgi:predicted nucleic acid-binding Zn ribbon protein
MTVFDKFALNIFNHYKPKLKQKASRVAIFYLSFFQISLLLLLGVFFGAFFEQMKVDTMSSEKAWTLFIIASIFIYFKNWMGFSGKKRNVLNAKRSKKNVQAYNIWLLWLLPFACIALALVLLQKT